MIDLINSIESNSLSAEIMYIDYTYLTPLVKRVELSLRDNDNAKREIITKIRELASLHSEGMRDTPLNLTVSKNDEGRRRLLSRIMNCSHFIATEHRRGLATTIIASKEVVDFMMCTETPDTNDYLYSISLINGMNVFICNDLGSEVIVFRKSGSEIEPGLHYVYKKEISLENSIIYDAIASIGFFPELAYLSFDVKIKE